MKKLLFAAAALLLLAAVWNYNKTHFNKNEMALLSEMSPLWGSSLSFKKTYFLSFSTSTRKFKVVSTGTDLKEITPDPIIPASYSAYLLFRKLPDSYDLFEAQVLFDGKTYQYEYAPSDLEPMSDAMPIFDSIRTWATNGDHEKVQAICDTALITPPSWKKIKDLEEVLDKKYGKIDSISFAGFEEFEWKEGPSSSWAYRLLKVYAYQYRGTKKILCHFTINRAMPSRVLWGFGYG